MIPREKHTLKDYKKAFMQFSGAGEHEFQIKKESGALALFEGQTYRICLYDDLLKEFKGYFGRDYTLIYTETPFALWEILFERHHEITDEDLIIDIFNAWNTYWENEQKFYGKRKVYEESRAQSRGEFNLLIKSLQEKPGDFIKNAIQISDITLIPVIALALRSRFQAEEDFYRECVDILIDDFPHLFSNDGNFDKVEIDTVNSDAEPFYIFQPEYRYEDEPGPG